LTRNDPPLAGGWHLSASCYNELIQRQLLEQLKKQAEVGPSRNLTVDEADFVSFQHRVPQRMGKWNLVPPQADKD